VLRFAPYVEGTARVGYPVHPLGSSAGFLFLAGIASAALAILYLFMPETRQLGRRAKEVR
jgi:hypothetical protein